MLGSAHGIRRHGIWIFDGEIMNGRKMLVAVFYPSSNNSSQGIQIQGTSHAAFAHRFVLIVWFFQRNHFKFRVSGQTLSGYSFYRVISKRFGHMRKIPSSHRCFLPFGVLF